MSRTPKYRRHSSGYAFVEWQTKRHYLPGLHGSAESRRAYREFLEKHVFPAGQTDAELSLPEGEITIAKLAVRYLSHAQQYYPNSHAHSSEYRNACKSVEVIIQIHSDLPAAEFGPKMLKALREQMVARGWSRGYINSTVGRIRRMFRWGATEELVPGSVWQSLAAVPALRRGRTQAREAAPVRPVPWALVWRTMWHADDVLWRMIAVQWYTGVRSDSLVHMTPRQIDRRNIPWLWTPKHKTEHLDKIVVIPLGPRVRRILGPLLDRPPDAPVFSPREARAWQFRVRRSKAKHRRSWAKHGGIPRRLRDHYDSDTYRDAVAYVQDRAGIPHWTPHQMRHSRGTLVREQYGAEVAQAILGHASLSATELYAERSITAASRVAEETG